MRRTDKSRDEYISTYCSLARILSGGGSIVAFIQSNNLWLAFALNARCVQCSPVVSGSVTSLLGYYPRPPDNCDGYCVNCLLSKAPLTLSKLIALSIAGSFFFFWSRDFRSWPDYFEADTSQFVWKLHSGLVAISKVNYQVLDNI